MADSHPQPEAKTAIDETTRFWRDMTVRILGWGTAFVLLVGGYTIEKHAFFELGILWSEPCGWDDILRAVGLLAFASLFAGGLPYAIYNIYAHRLTDHDHSAIIPRWIAIRYACLLGFCAWILAVLVSIF